jgi:hypothetical protein
MALKPTHFLLAAAALALANQVTPSSPVVSAGTTTTWRPPVQMAHPLRRPRGASSSSSAGHRHHDGDKKSSSPHEPPHHLYVAPVMALREALARLCQCQLRDDEGKLKINSF